MEMAPGGRRMGLTDQDPADLGRSRHLPDIVGIEGIDAAGMPQSGVFVERRDELNGLVDCLVPPQGHNGGEFLPAEALLAGFFPDHHEHFGSIRDGDPGAFGDPAGGHGDDLGVEGYMARFGVRHPHPALKLFLFCRIAEVSALFLELLHHPVENALLDQQRIVGAAGGGVVKGFADPDLLRRIG